MLENSKKLESDNSHCMRNLTSEQLLECVKLYEKEELRSDFVKISDVCPKLVIFQGARKMKMVAFTTHRMPSVEIPTLVDCANSILLKYPEYSETLEIFTTSEVSLSKSNELCESALHNCFINLSIMDVDSLRKKQQFESLFQTELQECLPDDCVKKALYDYMTMGLESNDIKNSLYHSVLLFEIYKESPVAIGKLIEDTASNFGRSIDNIQKDLDELRRERKVLPAKDDKTKIELSEDERMKLRDAFKTSKEEESLFMASLHLLLEKYGVANCSDHVLKILQDMFESVYNFSDPKQYESSQPGWVEKLTSVLSPLLKQKKEAVSELINEIHNLCENNDYLKHLSANQSFLKMYKDAKYEEYVNKRTNEIYLDTPAFAYYLCAKSEYAGEYDEGWPDIDYQSMVSLINIVETNSSKMYFCVPQNYIGETIGEIKKAIRLSWFYNELDVDFPISTANTFYNFYLHIRNQKKNDGDDITSFSITKFFENMNIPTDMDDIHFENKVMSVMEKCSKVYDFEITSVEETYSSFQDVKDEYLHEQKARRKSAKAIDNDIRQAFYIAESSESGENDCYFTTWDGSLFKLRDIVTDVAGYHRKYVVGSPSRILNRLSLKYFKLQDHLVTKELFAYADRAYNVNKKISSMFDNVLLPLFASTAKKNSKLVAQLLNLQKQEIDKDFSDKAQKDSNLRIENIFTSIEDILPTISCSWQNLKDYLSEEKNNDFVYGLIKDVYDAKRDYLTAEQISKFCTSIKLFVDEQDEEVTL